MSSWPSCPRLGAVELVQLVKVPSNCTNCFQWWDSNCPPQWVVMTEGTPNRTTHLVTNALSTVAAMISAIGVASVQHVNSPHMSIGMWSHLKVVMVPQYPNVYDQTECQVLWRWRMEWQCCAVSSTSDTVGMSVPTSWHRNLCLATRIMLWLDVALPCTRMW